LSTAGYAFTDKAVLAELDEYVPLIQQGRGGEQLL
jgi:hypothetical protein